MNKQLQVRWRKLLVSYDNNRLMYYCGGALLLANTFMYGVAQTLMLAAIWAFVLQLGRVRR